jgi:hypothetical protein
VEDDKAVVITTISPQDSPGVIKLLDFLELNCLRAVVVADKKTPPWSDHPNIDFLSIEKQNDLWPALSAALPFNHYSRKNLGYLRAASLGANSILDTDDDNCPVSNPWNLKFERYRLNNHSSWINIYRYFGEQALWPRGLPLNSVHGNLDTLRVSTDILEISCFQSVVDGDPDIDAIGRMLYPKKVFFTEEIPVVLGLGICPTNSQATLWLRWLLPLLYLPSTATFRMTDIWRGLILQPAIQVLEGNTVFGKLGFYQERNEHDLMKDFESEASGHINSEAVSQISISVWRSGVYSRDFDSILSGMVKIYEELVARKILGNEELKILGEWHDAISNIN